MATHSYKGQKGKNGQIKPKLDPEYAESIMGKLAIKLLYMIKILILFLERVVRHFYQYY